MSAYLIPAIIWSINGLLFTASNSDGWATVSLVVALGCLVAPRQRRRAA